MGLGSGVTRTVLPHANWRGLYDLGTFADGSVSKPELDLRTIEWPARNYTAFLRDVPPEEPKERVWLGALVTSHKDASGQMYRRNRYYDPVAGRFTQEDPIGLAGGLNLYGFAEGDPVNYSDPFGLCPIPVSSCVEAVERLQSQLVRGAVSTLGAIGEVTGVSGLMRAFSGKDAAGNKVGTGARLFEGGMAALGIAPIGRGARVAEKLVDASGSLRVSKTVANQLAGERSYIPSMAILEAVRAGKRVPDPQGVADHFMYTIGAKNGTLDVLVDEASHQIRHVLYRSQ